MRLAARATILFPLAASIVFAQQGYTGFGPGSAPPEVVAKAQSCTPSAGANSGSFRAPSPPREI